MEKDRIIRVLKDNNFWGKEQQLEVLRESYLQVMQKREKMKEALALVGVRRSGKSTLAKQFMSSLIKKGIKKEDTLYVNLEEPLFASSLNLELLSQIYEAYREIISLQPRLIVLDEVQNIPAWEKWVRSEQEKDSSLRIIVTGSSSKLLSSEFSTVLSGRATTLEVFPLSFEEFISFNGLDLKNRKGLALKQDQLRPLLRKYLEYGGFPRVVLEEKENKKILLKEYYESIVLRDVAVRYRIKEINLLKALTTILLTNISSPVSIGKLAKPLQESFKSKISLETISRFLTYLESAYLIYLVPIFSYKIKEQMQYPRKVYSIDCGLRNAISFRFSEDLGRLAENLVFLELKRKDKEIYYWKSGKDKEVDFVIKEGLTVKSIINVCWNLSSEHTKNRERSSLLEAMEEFKLKEGLIITEDYDTAEKFEGRTIRYIPLWKWLLQ